MNLTSYLLAGFNILINNQVTISGTAIDCIFDHIQITNGRNYGPQMEDVCSVTVKTSDLEFPRNYLKKIVIIDGQTFEVIGISKGNATTILSLVTTNKL